MRQTECVFEAEVLAAVLQLRWPDRAEAGLREHARDCAICSDVAAVASVIDSARDLSGVALPDSGVVWWKAQMRARREAVEAAGRPITAVQVVAFTCAVGLMGACIGATSSWFQRALRGVWGAMAGIEWSTVLPYAAAMISAHWMLAASLAALVFGMPLAIYLGIVRE